MEFATKLLLFEILLALLLGVYVRIGDALCSSGPYLYDESCIMSNQGIGSSMNRMKPAVFIAASMNATLIPNSACFKSDEHKTNLLEYFGWGHNLDCTENDVKFARDVSSDASEKGGAGAQLYKATITHGLHKKEMMVHGPKWKFYNDGLNTICKRAGGDDMTQEEFRTYIHKKEKQTETVFHHLYKAREKVREAGHSSAHNVVYVLRGRYLFEGYHCTRAFVAGQWRQKLVERKTGGYGREDEDNKVVVSFHFRHGDVATKNVNFIDPADVVRAMPLSDGVRVLKALLGPGSVLEAHKDKTVVRFYSEGDRGEFAELEKAFPNARFFLGDNASVAEDVDGMATSDIFLASPSSFSSLVGAINTRGVILVPNDNPEKFEGIDPHVPQSSLLQGQLATFNEAFCKAELFVRKAVTDIVCGRVSVAAAPAPVPPPTSPGTLSASSVGGNATPSFSIAPGEYDQVYREFQAIKSKARSQMTVRQLIALLPSNDQSDTIIGKLFADWTNEMDSHLSCRRNPDRLAFSMQEYQPTVCSSRRRRDLPPETPFSVALSYVARRVADAIVSSGEGGFQPRVYVVFGGSQPRKERITRHLAEAGILPGKVTWEDRFVAKNLTETDKNVFQSGRTASARCSEMMGMDRACKFGYQFSPVEMSVALKHLAILDSVAAQAPPSSSSSSRDSVLSDVSLVVEDDQFLYRDIRRRIVETVLHAPRRLGLVMLDDSFFFNPTYMPPSQYENFPFQGSYPRAESRTVGAYLVFDDAARVMKQNNLMSPIYAPVDHQMRYAISKGAILTHWAWPPMTCAGSQGLETYYTKSTTGGINMDSGDRLNCKSCCDRFVNVTSMLNIYDFMITA